MVIAGLDISETSTGAVVFNLNDNIDQIDMTFMGFTDKKYVSEVMPNCKLYKKFDCYLDRSFWMWGEITKFLAGADIIAIEDYAFAGKGQSFHLGEFAGGLKSRFYDDGKKIRLYDITAIKMFATGNGNATKDMMAASYDNLICPHKINFNCLDKALASANKQKVLKLDSSPRSDLVDAFFITRLLQTELALRKGLVSLKTFPEHHIKVFNRTTKTNSENLLVRDWDFHRTVK